MSDYQFIHFLACDECLDQEQLAFMRQQSKRAMITEWEFGEENHSRDFRGNAEEMLRRGYDAHLHFDNFGIRRLMFRLHAGLPCERKVFESFLPEKGVKWHADPSPTSRPAPFLGACACAACRSKERTAGILEISPQGEAASYAEDFDRPVLLLREMAPLERMLGEGDLRPLYLAWLRCNRDEHALEPPVPAGLGKLTLPLKTLARFYEVPGDLIAAAAEQSPALPETTARQRRGAWLAQPGQEELRKVLDKIQAWDRKRAAGGAPSKLSKGEMEEFCQTLRGEFDISAVEKALFRGMTESHRPAWPLAEPTRSMAQSRELAARGKKADHARRSTAKRSRKDPARADRNDCSTCAGSVAAFTKPENPEQQT